MPDTHKYFDSDFFKSNRRQLQENLDGAPIIIAGNGQLQRSTDTAYPFRQDSNFWYLTGIDEAGLILVITDETEYLVLPKISEYMAVFDGEIKNDELRGISGIRKIYSQESGWEELKKTISKTKRVYSVAPPPEFIEELDMFTNPARARLRKSLLELKPRLKISDVKQEIAALRSVKQDPEINVIKKATTVTMQAFVAMSRRLPKLNTEYELEAVATGLFRANNMQHAYEPIVASGERANTLHYSANDQRIRKNQLALIDIGAEFLHYSSDLTRTIGVNPTARQMQIHSAVIDIHEYALSILYAGMSFRDYELEVRDYLGEKLRELKLIKRISKKAIRKYFPHAVTHPVGLDLHDPYPADGIIRPGMILTIEPGIYVEEEGIGIRTEDIVLVKDKSIVNLSGKLSHNVKSLRMS